MIDRSSINRCLAKAIAYKQCGKDKEAECWAIMLVQSLEVTGILDRASPAMDRLKNSSMSELG